MPADAFEFVATGSLAEPRIHAAATLLDDGRVLVVGGYEVASAEIWDPDTGQWTMSGSMARPREGATATLLPDGRVLVAGGWVLSDPSCHQLCGVDPTDTAVIGDPATSVSTPTGPMTHPRTEHASVLLRDGRVLLVGSHTHGDADFTAELFQVRASSTA